jgi:molecular chaperone GrpE
MSGETQDSAQDNIVDLHSEPQVEESAPAAPEPTPMENLQAELDATTARLKTVSAGYLKVQEEMTAFKARLERQASLREQILKGDVVSKLFEPLENLRRSIDALERGGVDKELLGGVNATHKGFSEGFKSMGLEEIIAQGERFDPNQHEALTTMPVQEAALDERVVQVFSAGYRVGTRVIRPARVVVGAYTAPPVPDPEANDEQADSEPEA